MKPKYSQKYVSDYINKKNGALLSKRYKTSLDKIKIRCNICDRIWITQFCSILRGTWCPTCSNAKQSLGDIKEFICEQKNGIILSDINYRLYSEKIKILCSNCGAEWFGYLNQIKLGQMCPNCIGIKKYNICDIFNIISEKNIELITKHYANNKQLLVVRCKICLHKWKTSFAKLNPNNSYNTGCPNCANNLKYSQEYVKEYIKKNNGTLLSIYNGANNKIKIKCNSCETIWNPTFASIKNQCSWCPRCKRKISKKQEKLAHIIKTIYSSSAIVHNNYTGFDWLKTDYGKQEIDIFVVGSCGITIGIEYDGEHHFWPVRYGGISKTKAISNLERCKVMDNIKDNKMKKHRSDVNYFIRFSCFDEIDHDSVLMKIKKNNIPVF